MWARMSCGWQQFDYNVVAEPQKLQQPRLVEHVDGESAGASMTAPPADCIDADARIRVPRRAWCLTIKEPARRLEGCGYDAVEVKARSASRSIHC